jgi:hypothetical protein
MILPALNRIVLRSALVQIAQLDGFYVFKTGQSGQTGQQLGAISVPKPHSYAFKLASGTVHRQIPVACDVSRPIGAAHAGPQGGAHQPVARRVLPAPAARRVSCRPFPGERARPSQRAAGSRSFAPYDTKLPVRMVP